MKLLVTIHNCILLILLEKYICLTILISLPLILSFFSFDTSSMHQIKEASSDNCGINNNLVPNEGSLITCTDWTEFVSAAEAAVPGDIIQLKDGTYSGNIKFSKSGTSEKPITIIPENRGRVLITGNSKWEISGKYITVDGFYFLRGTSTRPLSFSLESSHCRLLNSAFIAWNLGGKETKLITIGGTNNEVGHCVLREKNTAGMMLEVVRESSMRNDHNIHHVYFGYFKSGSGNGFETVRISTSRHSLSSCFTKLESCVFERCDGESEIISNKSGDNIYRSNTFLNSDGALTLRHGHDALVENNVFIYTVEKASSRCTGVRVIGERHVVRNNYFLNLPKNSPAIQIEYGNEVPHRLSYYDQVKDALIENNTIYNCDKGIHIGARKKPAMSPPRIMAPSGTLRNNLIVSNKGNQASLEIEEEVLSNNLFTYSNNIISGKSEMNMDKERLPAGVHYVPDLKIANDNTGLFWPNRKGYTVGAQDKDIKPLHLKDIVPTWIKCKIDENDPNFVEVPW